MTKDSKIPNSTIERLAFYSRPLEALLKDGPPIISSEKLAGLCGVNAAQVRKDLAYFGEFGVRGVGYEIKALLREIKRILGTDRKWTLCIVGIGNLGISLVENENFRKRGYVFVAAFDSDARKVGTRLPCGLTVEHEGNIGKVVKALEIKIGVITTPARAAQRVAGILSKAGIKAILNFAPIQVRTPERCIIENVDFSVRLENLVYHLERLYKGENTRKKQT
ncbi:MAG: redox-sensing transcriptional repressor Rex [Deltaproteobacteria bacterium]|nr:redox-sensing transcriptional repressor Rex [Deltaproteobacteria bacterium]MBW2047602.1 redox-sensing transcriptional repressor Rex [Deltaproteobacteria bacterium]MBW2112016.1 redox-sensing transcriptional repressor Rex [Deltaproteobacteria bacterium]MBW2351949.1 redox-sensing transcriptional repressor Rex [Deltaproteobacteria bacterium]HDZ91742.1 redox-sensing transcriptional repressor Rex [Deltaproteobacteria bacterium]